VTGDLSRLLNALGLVLVCIVLLAALFDQFWFGDLPCPLCTLQRAAFVAVGLGLVLNIVFGPKPSHYAVIILSAAAGAAIAIRQTLLHIVPNSGSYGNAVLGLHLYSWAFVLFALVIVGSAAMLLSDRQFAQTGPISARLRPLPLAAFLALVALTVILAVSTFALCGAGLCPDAPAGYWMFGGQNAAPPAPSPAPSP
jgi:disulfide bond formation protein DsbB